MDNAVALVQAYLRVNGYLTVTVYPIVEALPAGGFQTATDLDVLGFRFGHSRMPQSPRAPMGAGRYARLRRTRRWTFIPARRT